MGGRRRLSPSEQYYQSIEETSEIKSRRLQFYHNLRFFYKRKWNVNLTLPVINGIDIDLFKLYDKVSSIGGWHRVTSLERWHEIAQNVLGFGENVAGGEYCAKLIYMRYLSKFEQCESVGDIDDNENEMGSRSRVRGFSTFVSSECPLGNPKRGFVDDDCGYDRIVKGLCSGLPNEEDFCVNLCTVLSAPGPHALQVETCEGIIPLLLAQVAIFDDCSDILEQQFKRRQKEFGRNFDKFWFSVGITDPEVLNLLPDTDGKPTTVEDINLFPALSQVKLTEKAYKLHELRVNQVLNIIRNLSFDEQNRAALAYSFPLMKFLTICMACDDYPIRNSALETLGELASSINLCEDFMASFCYIILRHLRAFLMADDRFLIIRATEILGGLCNVSENESLLCEFFDTEVVERLRDLMTVQDVLICTHVLDSIYMMSGTGKSICDKICDTSKMLPTLVNFTTIEGNKFTASALQGIKVVEYREEVERSQPYQTYAIRNPTALPQSQTVQARLISSVQPVAGASYRPHIVVNSKGEYPLPLPKTALTAQLSKPAEMSSEFRVEHFSKIWIRQNCQSDPSGVVDRGDIYAAYVENFRNTHKILSCSLVNFCKFIKDIFPSIEIKQNPQTKVMCIEGIRFLKKDARVANATPNTKPVESNENIAPEKIKAEIESERCNGVINKKSICNGAIEVKKELNGQCNGGSTKTEIVENGMPKSNGDSKKTGNNGSAQESDDEPHSSVDHEEIVETSDAINGKNDSDESVSSEKNGDSHENGTNEILKGNGVIKEDSGEKEQTVKEHLEQKELLNGYIRKNNKRQSDESLQNGTASKKPKTLKKKPNAVDPVDNGIDSPSTSAVPITPTLPTLSPSKIPQFMCEWDVCTRYFHNGQSMIYHVLHEHLGEVGSSLSLCKWPGCERTPRSRWSMITHLQDHHCNETVLSNAQRKRRDMGDMNYIAQMKKLLETETPATNHAGYSKFAAYDAIRRHAFNFMTKEFTDEQEGPVTKNLRLTSCLILRNLASNSLEARKKIRQYEGLFSYLAMSRMESSSTVAHLLGAISSAEA
ncbi:unnamed protein product [Bursaphelenchus okinawaensis]|uniref:ARID domain-containing protein n=1 Tax=Bursaphelenchus okinawaensis TaxID=465554 RepID=A0A811K8C8_9BILA|nr:unnamed protein product [Bursaphelenchus okinawaensis]CAG9093086.1 unnamed protein product [Bursaphelenchus okinawaensis]